MDNILKTYLENEWRENNPPKYQHYFNEWYGNLTESQLHYYKILWAKL